MRSLAIVALLAGVLLADDWPVFRGTPGQTGVAASKVPDKLEVLWKFSSPEDGAGFEHGVAVAGGVVYAPCLDEQLYAFELATGKAKWKFKGGPFKAPPAVKGDLVQVGDLDGVFYALDVKDGKQKWKFDVGAEAGGANFEGDVTLVTSHDESLYAIDKDGKKKWRFKAEGAIYGSVSVSQGKTFLVGCDSKLHVIDLATGKEERAVDLEAQTAGTAAVIGDVLYVGTMGSRVKAINWKTGKEAWEYKPTRSTDGFYSSPAVTDKYVVIGSRDKKVHCIDRADGKGVWTFTTGNKVDSSPVIAGDKVVIGSTDEHLYVLSLEKGKPLEKIKLDGQITASPVVVGGKVLIGTQKGTLYCLGAK